ncbi:MAG: amidohydrolase family protein [Acidobacteriota bacterium]
MQKPEHRARWCAVACMLLLGSALSQPAPASTQADAGLLLRDALIVDGRGRVPYLGEVLIADGRITAVGEPGSVVYQPGMEVRNLGGLTLAPGFIDIHNHSTDGLLRQPRAEALVSQGLTTVVVGADGSSPWPVSDYLKRLEQARPAVNVAVMAGHGTIRRAVMGEDFRREATDAEIEAMKTRLQQAMAEGAFGLSTGLEYDPGFYSSTAELIALSRVAAADGGFYMSHMRDEEEGVMEAIDEAIEIGRSAGLPVQISHIKMGNASVWGRAAEALAKIRSAIASGLDITADWYPYPAWSSSLSIVVRSRRFTDPETVAEGLAALGGPHRLQITNYPPDRSIEGLRLDEIAEHNDLTPVEQYIDMMRNGGASVIGHTMSRDDVDTFAADPLVMVASDGGIGSSHPRGAGTFPRVLSRYVRERGLLPIERAIYKMTSLPARRLGLSERGTIEVGAVADLVAFDAATVSDRSTFEQPHLLATGIDSVWVGGELVWKDGKSTGNRPGQVLR